MHENKFWNTFFTLYSIHIDIFERNSGPNLYPRFVYIMYKYKNKKTNIKLA